MKSLDDVIENLKTKQVHPFEPGLDIELYKQEELSEVQKNRVREKNPQNLEFPGNSLIRRDRNPCGEKIILRNFLRRNPPRPRTGIEELDNKNDFIKWFDDKYDIPDGTYHGQYNFGGTRGYSWLFVFEVKHGSIKKSSWKKKSNGKARDRSSRYYALPYYFKERKTWNV